MLIALTRSKGEVVGRDELVESCWDGRFVSDDVINRAVLLIRGLAERSGGFAIETVPRAGYRLVEMPLERHRAFPIRATAAGIGLVALAGVALWLSQPDHQDEPPMPTIALLPVSSVTPDQATRELATATRDSLGHTLAESGFPVKLVQAASVGAGAPDLIISGDIRDGRSSATATIRVEAKHRAVVYSRQFQASGKDLKLLPERIGAQVAAVLAWTGALMVLDHRHPSNPADTLEQLRQMALVIEGGDPLGAYEISRRTAPREPNSAIAQLGLAFNTGFALGELPRNQRTDAVAVARAASERAQQLAPEFGDVYIPWCILHSMVNTAECEDRLRAAMRKDTDAPFVMYFLSAVVASAGRQAEALDLARQSLVNDRYKVWAIARAVRTLEARGRTSEAEALFAQGSRWWPDSLVLVWSRREGMLARGDFEAMERFEREPGSKVLGTDRTPSALVAAVREGNAAAAKRICKGSAPLKACMVALGKLGDTDDAIAIAGQLYPDLRGRTEAEEDRIWLDHPTVLPLDLLSSDGVAPLRRDPRFLAVAQRVGLLSYWRKGRLPDFCTVRREPVCNLIKDGR